MSETRIENPVLIIIDMQKDFVALSPLIAQAIPPIQEVLEMFREAELPIIHVIREYEKDLSNVEWVRIDQFKKGNTLVIKGTDGAKIVDELLPEGEEPTIVKSRFSAFFKTGLDNHLKDEKAFTLIITGTQTPNCVRETVMDAISLDYEVILIKECTASQTKEVQEANLKDMENLGVPVLSLLEFKELWGRQ